MTRQTNEETPNPLLLLCSDRKDGAGSHHGVLGQRAKHATWKVAGGFNTLGRQTQPPAAEASKCDGEECMGDGDKGTEAGENLACSQTAWWSGVGRGYCMFSKGHSATWQDTVAQHPGKLVGLRWLQGGAPWLSAKREAQRENEGPARRLRASGESLPRSCNTETEGQELLLGLAKDRMLWRTLGASHRPLPPPPPPPWPPASGAPDIMRNSTTGMMYIHCRWDRWTKRQTERKGCKW